MRGVYVFEPCLAGVCGGGSVGGEVVGVSCVPAKVLLAYWVLCFCFSLRLQKGKESNKSGVLCTILLCPIRLVRGGWV